MGLASFAQMLVLAVAATDTPIQPPPSGPDLPEPIFTRQTLFSIPFQIDTAGDPARQAAEIQLLVSTDRGRTWQTFTSVEPARSQFLFRASGDGRYWFQVRTLDRSGKIRPEPTNRPGLCIVVDTTPPQLDLEARQGEAGQITAKWQLAEQHLHADGLSIQYRLHSDEPWQTVAIDPQAVLGPGPAHSGQVTWVPNTTGRILEIRAEATDSAGNRVVNHAQVALARDPGVTTTPGLNTATAAATAGTRATLDGWADDREMHGGPPASHSPDKTRAAEDDLAGWSPKKDPSVAESWESSIAAQSHPPIHDRFVPDSERTPNDRVGPPQGGPQMINTCLLELGYEVDLAGAGSVDRVELWATRDGGQTWSNFGLDADNQSPVMARVDGEGTWGFLITIRDGRGLGGGPPQPGDTPDILVGVDLTDPVARILSSEPTAPDHQGPILIRWEAADAALLKRPISLHRRLAPGGPWIPIASDLENTGEYQWWRDRETPQPISFRLEVRDAAGNVGVFETPEARSPNAQGPAARIHGVRPADRSTQNPSRSGYFR